MLKLNSERSLKFRRAANFLRTIVDISMESVEKRAAPVWPEANKSDGRDRRHGLAPDTQRRGDGCAHTVMVRPHHYIFDFR